MSHPNTLLRLIKEWGECPPDGYRYVFPETGYTSHGWAYVDWVNDARAHVAANPDKFKDKGEGYPTLEAQMQNQLCSTLPPGFCLYDDPGRPRPSTSITFNDVAAGLKTFTRWIASGMKYVPESEANRRGSICSKCYLNVNVQGCSGCQAAVEEVVRDKHSKYDAALRACAVCKCFLKAKIHFPITTLDTQSVKVQSMYPDFCWLNPNSENYRAEEELDSKRTQPKA